MKTWSRKNAGKLNAARKEKRAARNALKPKIERDNAQGRLCSTCSTRKPLAEFDRLASGPDGYHWRCKTCLRAHEAKWKQENPERALENSRRKGKRRYARNPDKFKAKVYSKRLQYLYGIPHEARLEMLRQQNFSCKICQKSITEPNGKQSSSAAQVDHDHVTGRIRGMLCIRCNTGLGALGDNPDLLRAAIAYLT